MTNAVTNAVTAVPAAPSDEALERFESGFAFEADSPARIVGHCPWADFHSLQGADRESHMTYAPERREAVLKKMMPPNAVSVPELSRTENIAEQTLYRWRKHARLSGRLMPDTDTIPDWSSADKSSRAGDERGRARRVLPGEARERLAAWRAAWSRPTIGIGTARRPRPSAPRARRRTRR